MPNIMKDLKKDGFRASKNGFPQDYYNTFSAKLGQLLPAFHLETVPQGYYEIDVADITETALLSTKAFAGMTCNLDFYFVPFTALWSLYNQFHTGRADRQDAHFTGYLPEAAPTIDLATLISDMIYDHSDTISNVTGNLDLFNAHSPNNGKLMDLLNYGFYTPTLSDDPRDIGQYPSVGAFRTNLFRAQAYQCIWYHYYRNKYYDTNILPTIFNMDDVGYNIASPQDADLIDIASECSKARIQSIFTMRYCQKKKDLFNALLPSASFGAVQTVSVSTSVPGQTVGSDLNRWHSSNSEYPYISFDDDVETSAESDPSLRGNLKSDVYDEQQASVKSSILHDHVFYPESAAGHFSVLDLAKSEAMQKWAYTTLRQGNDTREQMKGHHGVTPDFDPVVMPRFLGSYDAVININKVDITASSGGQKAGQYVGQGFCSLQGNTIKFEASDFGIIMAVYSVRPDLQRPSVGLDKNNTLMTRFDFFTPELDNTGLTAVTQSELDIYQSQRNLGFAPSFYNHKQKINQCHGEFITHQGFKGLFSQFVLSDTWTDPFNGGARDIRSLYVSPGYANAIFVPQTEYVGEDADYDTPANNEATDIFYPNFYFNVRSVLPISKLGLPQF